MPSQPEPNVFNICRVNDSSDVRIMTTKCFVNSYWQAKVKLVCHFISSAVASKRPHIEVSARGYTCVYDMIVRVRA